MQPKTETFHVLACPATRRALRQQNYRVNWCLDFAAQILDGKAPYSDVRIKGVRALSPGVICFGGSFPHVSYEPNFTITTRRSRLYNNEVVLLISQSHHLEDLEFELLVKRSQPLVIV